MGHDNLFAAIDESTLIELTRAMIQMETVNPPGDEIFLAERLATMMKDLGLDAGVVPFAERRGNVVCRLHGSGGRPVLLFNGHLDTVPLGTEPWNHDPFSGNIAAGRIYGRGASDMKGGVAAMIVAAAALKRCGIGLKGTLLLAFTAGEEVDSIGASHLLENGVLNDADALVIAEPTGLDIGTAEKGALWLEAVMKGKAAHGSSPHLGRNAIVPMAAFVQKIGEMTPDAANHVLLGGPTMNIGTIEGGFKTNVVPDRCRLTLDFRTIPGQDIEELKRNVETLVREIAERHGAEWSLRTLNERAPVDTSANDPFVREFVESARGVLGREPSVRGMSYYTDGALLAPALKVPMIICGPGEAGCAHQADEWVDIENLRLAAQIYADFAARFLK